MNVLIAVKSPETAGNMKEIAEELGHRIFLADDLKGALESWEAHEIKFVITEIESCDMDGLELCRRIRSSQRKQYAYVMLLKEKGKNILRGEILEAGADSCVSKPVDPDEFKAQLNAGERIVRLEKELKEAFHNIKSKNEVLEKTLHELQTTQAQMLQSEKMSSIGQLAAGIAHEINNPTGFVSSNLKTLGDYLNDISELIKEYRLLVSVLVDVEKGEKIPDSVPTQLRKISAREEEIDLEFLIDDIKDIIEDCKEGTDRIKKIVVNLKEFAHPGEDELQRKDINQGIESTLSVVWNELKYKADVIKDLGELPSVKCYPQQLNQVFMNLLINGSQAIEGRGEIRIKTRAAEKYIEVEISDTGSGIPKENLGKIFDPFFTTKGVGKGTGLGLNVSYNIIKKHHGTLEVESEVGKGSLFRIRIPVE